ncbi:MAG: tRNA pseudouridine(38-40) synthase TruA [Chloroflexota bacterium]|nr:tRNA pseudouridine(38-40) synthase TruA [Chloroflexota bacterium]
MLQAALLRITQEAIVVEFAGRTDAGVHARGQVISFHTHFKHGPVVLQRGMKAVLPHDVAVREATEVDEGFHARRSARRRWYRYTVQNGSVPQPLLDRYSYFYPRALSVELMNEAGQELVGTHDFLAFGDVPGGRGSSVRCMSELTAGRSGDLVTIDLKATAFLKHMARSVAGLLLRVGSRQIAASEAGRVLRERDRHAAGPVAPPRGLCLMGVEY